MAKNVKARLAELSIGVDCVSHDIFEQWREETGASESYLRRLLRAAPMRLDALVEGVRQDDRDHLARTLKALAEAYQERPAEARKTVLESKTHTRLVLRKKPEDAWRLEVLLHLNVWLENPPVYGVWADLKVAER